MSEPFIAEIKAFGFNFNPRGWAFCDGALLPVSQHTALFSILGTTFGGDGRTTFGLPNLQARLPMHPGNGAGLTQRRLGQSGGVNTVTLNETHMPTHRHTLRAFPSAEASNPTSSRGLGNAPMYQVPNADAAPMAAEAVGTTGGGQAHDNLQPFLAVNFCIALSGVFPSRS